ncbi:hypothetical protein D3C78_992930 [compost metagenome]
MPPRLARLLRTKARVWCTRSGRPGRSWRRSRRCSRIRQSRARGTSLVTMTVEASVIARVKWSLVLRSLRKPTTEFTWPSRNRSKLCWSITDSMALKSWARASW